MVKRTSNCYIATLSTESVNDMQTLDILRKTVKALNNINLSKSRVCVRGRKPYQKTENKSFDRGGNIVGGIRNASMYDVYVYRTT